MSKQIRRTLFRIQLLVIIKIVAYLSFVSLVQQQVQLQASFYTDALPVGFIDEGIATINGPNKAIFAPNPRQNGKPMMLVCTKDGLFYAIEDPDNSSVIIQIADMRQKLCTNGPRGVYSIEPHPDFLINRYLYVYYTNYTLNCPTDPILGPVNRLSRFTVDATTLQIIISSEVIYLETPPSPILLHDGGGMFIGRDRLIYLGIGDGGAIPYAQDTRMLYGKLIRLTLEGAVPLDNPYTTASGGKGVNCRSHRGRPLPTDPIDAVCEEMYAIGLRNPFRIGLDPNIVDKIQFAIGDVGNAVWEEISLAGTDYKGTNYGFGNYEGPCPLNTLTNCPAHPIGYTEPFHYYIHSPTGGAVTGVVYIPNGLWPAQYKFMFIEYVEGKIVNLISDPTVGCRTCLPPRSSYRNETFHRYDRMVDVFFGPYQNTKAMYYLSRGAGQTIRRIRYIGGNNQPPKAIISTLSKTNYAVNELISFNGGTSTDPEGSALTYLWKFGDGRTSTLPNPVLSYSTRGPKNVELIVTDSIGLSSNAFITVPVGPIPTASIIYPEAGLQYNVQDRILLRGRATSAGQQLNASQLFWEMEIRHATHAHPFMSRVSGNDIVSFPAPAPEDFMAATNSFLRVILTAVDNFGMTTTIRRDIYPKKVFVDILSNVPGLIVLVGEFNVVTPATITTWQNQRIKIEARNQGQYNFTNWNMGGPQIRTYLIPAQRTPNLRIVANFVAV